MVDAIKVGRDALDRVLPFENGSALNVVGLINVADSMAAVKKLVFDEKKVTTEGVESGSRGKLAGKRIRRDPKDVPGSALNIGNGDSVC